MLTKWTKPEDIAGLYAGDRILMVCEERSRFGKMENHVVILEATEDGWTSPDETYIGYTPGDGTDWISEKDFRELLAIREAGDGEVRRLEAECFDGADHGCVSSAAVRDLAWVAIARGQQLREAQAENSRYHDEAEVADALVLSLQEEVKTLTAERDEARKELAVLKAAPGMDEVDALGKSATQTLAQIVLDRPETNRPAIDTVPAGRYAKLRDLIDAMLATCRRSIAARDEVVGLLKWLKDLEITGVFMKMSLGQMMEHWKQGHGATEEFLSKRDRILEIVEGK